MRARSAAERACAAGAASAGVIWLAVYVHQAFAHGVSELDERRLVLGLTWMDSAKLLVASPLLLLAALASLYRLRGCPGRLGQLGFLVTGAALALLAVGTALEFWPFAWGSYGASFEATSRLHGGLLQALASLTLTLGLVVLALDLHRARFAPFWIAPVLGAGALTTVYLTPVLPVPGLVCLVLGAAVWRRPRAAREPLGAPRATVGT